MYDANHRRAGLVAAGLIASVALAACGGGSGGGPGVASAGSSTTAGKAGAAPKKSALAYSRCMRSHGVPDFPDPNSKGEITLEASPGSGSDLQPDAPQFKRADQACKALMPGPPGSPAQQRKDFAQALKFAKCMRAHGLRKFPDPQPPGSGPQSASKNGKSGDLGFAPDSPQFKKAQQACQSLAPGGGQLSTHEAGS